MHDSEARNPASWQGHEAISQANSNAADNTKTTAADQQETALAAAFHAAARRKAVVS